MTSTPTVAVSPTVTATVLPLALTVNGEGILLSEYESDLSRLRKENEGVSQPLPDDELENRVLDELIGQTLMAQTAYQNGFNLTEEELDSYLNGIIQSAGGEEVYQNWMRENGYQDESIILTLKRQLAAALAKGPIDRSVSRYGSPGSCQTNSSIRFRDCPGCVYTPPGWNGF